MVGIFPNEAAVTRLIGALLLEQNDEWAVQRARYMTLVTIAPMVDDLAVSLRPPWRPDQAANAAQPCQSYTTPWDTTQPGMLAYAFAAKLPT